MHDRDFSAAANIATAPIGPLIPPSNVMIGLFPCHEEPPVAALFMAGHMLNFLGTTKRSESTILQRRKDIAASKVKYSFMKKGYRFPAIPCLLKIVIVTENHKRYLHLATEGGGMLHSPESCRCSS